jgi:leucyl/phenylalanyl-tRNA--protein transferase
MHWLRPTDNPVRFPSPATASREGLLAAGGNLLPETLRSAYRQGIFPWYNPGEPILWWSPDPRTVLAPDALHCSRSLRKTLRQRRFHVTFDTRFRDVMLACAGPRAQYPGGGTWITHDMVEAYCALHALGDAHSVEVWQSSELVGGLYGVALGGAFFGESMFSRVSDASKVALAALCARLRAHGFALIDCQLPSDHLSQLGAVSIPRRAFLARLETALALPVAAGPWHDAIDDTASLLT